MQMEQKFSIQFSTNYKYWNVVVCLIINFKKNENYKFDVQTHQFIVWEAYPIINILENWVDSDAHDLICNI